MGFIQLNDGTVIHTSELPVLGTDSIEMYSYETTETNINYEELID